MNALRGVAGWRAPLVMLALVAMASCDAAPPMPIEVPLKNGVPMSEVISDLQAYIPAKMKDARVTGLSIALVRDGHLVWAQGFGQASRGRAMTADTISEAASFGKPIAAYAALKLRDEGRIEMDRPLRSYLPTPYLRASRWGDEITLRQVLTHTSGLSNSVIGNTRVRFQPGARFSYSGVGFEYLQKVIEQITGMPFDDYMRESVFQPLGMTSTSYAFRPEFEPRVARRYLDIGFVLPIPSFLNMQKPDAKNLVRSTPSDIARFMVELMEPRHIAPATIDEMMTEHAHVADQIWWGLGIGLQRSKYGESFWHWGDSPGIQNLMVGYRAQRLGVVIMSNSNRGFRIEREIAARAIGGAHYAYWHEVNRHMVLW